MHRNSSSQVVLPGSDEEPTSAGNQCAKLRDGYLTQDARRTELILGPTGAFRPLVELYMKSVAPNHYKAEDLFRVRGSMGKFLRFVVQNQHIEEILEIRPSTVTAFIRGELERGVRNRIVVGHLSRFFEWLVCDFGIDLGNPVVPRMHRALLGESKVSNGSYEEMSVHSDE